MSLSGIIITILILLILYYIGMIIWDQYQYILAEKLKEEVVEEEIDISSDLNGTGDEPVLVEVTSDSHSFKKEKKQTKKSPFPWTTEQIVEVFKKIELEPKCEELENVVFYTKSQMRLAV